MRRLVALVAAVAMVAGAFALRSALDGGDDDGDGSGGGGTSAEGARVVCVTELGPVCEAVAERDGLEVEVAPYRETLDLLASAPEGGDVGFDAWVAPAPLTGMVADDRARRGLPEVLDDPGEPVARSPLVIVAWDDRVEALADTCEGTPGWSCLGEVADAPWAEVGGEAAWGRVKPGHDDPGTSAVGLLVAAQAAGERLDRADFASNDFVEPGFRDWFTQLERTVAALDQPSGGGPLTRMIGLGPAAYDAVGTTEAEAVPQVARSARYGDRLRVLHPEVATTVDVVVAPVAGRDAGQAAADRFRTDDAAEAFAGAGWRVPGRPDPELVAAGDPPALPDDDGTTAPGALTALLALWEEIT